jgi:hypothetical protein
MDLVTFCEEALGDNTNTVDSVLKDYLKWS